MDDQFAGKVVLVTGGSKGIGRATATMFARRGAKVAVADIDVKAGGATVAAINDAGEDSIFVEADLALESTARFMVQKTVAQFGRLDCAVNAAALVPDCASIADADLDVFDRMIAVSLRGVLASMKYEIRQMLGQGDGGAIVNVASINASRPQPMCPSYTAAKHGVVGLTKCGSIENAPHGIRVNADLPGAIETEMLVESAKDRGAPLSAFADTISLFGRLGTPDEIAEAIVWLCSDQSSYVTGHSLAVDAGYTSR